MSCMYLFYILTQFNLKTPCPDRLMDHIVRSFLSVWITFLLPSAVAVLIYILTKSKWWSQFLYILSNTCFLFSLIVVILSGIYCCLQVVLTCISLIINGAEHFVIHLLDICMSSFEKFRFFTHFFAIFMFPFERQLQRERESQLNQDKARIQEFVWLSQVGGRDPSTWTISLCFSWSLPQSWIREAQTWTDAYMGFQYCV